MKIKLIPLVLSGAVMLSAAVQAVAGSESRLDINSTAVAPESSSQTSVDSLNWLYGTKSYIRCAYRINTLAEESSDVASGWEWAMSPQNPHQYAYIKGYWKSSAKITNMFYTDVRWQTLQDICRDTLKRKGINYETMIPYAGNSFLSWYYTIWSQGSHLPVSKALGMELDRMIIFGDSLSDTMNVYNASYGAVPNASTWYLGHFSNGPLWHEYLSNEQLFIPSYVWATANAESGHKLFFPSFKQQLDNYKSYMKQARDYHIDKTLFFILFGGNDFITGGKTPEQIIANYRAALPELASMGAKQIAVFRLPDFSIVPAVKTWTEAQRIKLRQNIQRYNDQLMTLLASLREQYPDTAWIAPALDEVFTKVINNPQNYGFSDTKNPCLTIKRELQYWSHYKPSERCQKSNASFVFWDEMHPTTKMHHTAAQLLFTDIQRQFKQQLAVH